MGRTFLIDTNIIIYYLKDAFSSKVTNKVDTIFAESFRISIISEIELLGNRNVDDKTYQFIKSFLNMSMIYPLDNIIKDRAIELKRQTTIKLPDAVIAATAMVNNLVLFTRNEKDFTKIDGLKTYNLFK